MRPIVDLAADMGLDPAALEPYGNDKAKIPLSAFPETAEKAKLIVVTAITPTPAGEGKSTTALALATRYYKRIGGHVLNILSSVVMPLHKVDYYDEEELPETPSQ